jgi:hypothetical protein
MAASTESSFEHYDASYLKKGMKFTGPVFFDDGENMFLAPHSTVKAYHIQAVKRWKIGTVLTRGKLTSDSPQSDGGVIPVETAPPGKQPASHPSLAETLIAELLASRAAANKMAADYAGAAGESESGD